MRRIAVVVALALGVAWLPGLAADYTQAAGSKLQFSGTYQGDPFSGSFPGFSTTLRFDPKQLADARLDVAIPISRVTAGVEDYDVEMRGEAFFNAARFPQAHYTATKFRALGGNRFAADGVLALRGVTKPVTLVFTWTPGPKPTLVGKATVKRLDFNVGGGEWADTELLPDAIAVTTTVVFSPKP